jgi:hypothetical protein
MLVALASVALWAVIATVETVSRDGYRAVPVDVNYDARLGSAAPAWVYR